MISTQNELDYINAALKRVSSDTRLLEKKTTLTLPASTDFLPYLTLPSEVVRLEAVYNGTSALQLIPTAEYMRLATGATSTTSNATTDMVCVIVGRRLYVWPGVSVAVPLTAIYSYRTADIDSSSTFELTGVAERLVERLSSAYALMDDGQPELAQTELQAYQIDSTRLRHRNRRAEGRGGVVRLAGRRRPPR